MKGISVVVCCYNSIARIGETLTYLSNQKVPADVAWEIVLVDNASTDRTADFAREHALLLRQLGQVDPQRRDQSLQHAG